jgi:phage gp36-like protein
MKHKDTYITKRQLQHRLDDAEYMIDYLKRYYKNLENDNKILSQQLTNWDRKYCELLNKKKWYQFWR